MSSSALGTQKKPRKERAQLSCTFCRHRKLKCDRNQPCQNCVKRSQGSTCHFATPQGSGVGKQQSPESTGLQKRIQHLEHLVVSLMNGTEPATARQAASGGQKTPPAPSIKRESSSASEPSTQDAASDEETVQAFGKMSVYGTDTTYVGNEHWVSILDDIAEVKKQVYEDEEPADSPQDYFFSNVEGPDLLVGTAGPQTVEEFLAALPPKVEVDRLVSRWLTSPDPMVSIIHLPTFELDYGRFWKNPQAAPLTWISLVYGMMSQASALKVLSAEPGSDMATVLLEDAGTYRRLAAQCLVASNYTKPVRWTLEALMLYLANEFSRTTETQMGLLLMLGMVIRLAMRLGYHRDSDHFPQISVFHGEMRRRFWAMMIQLDLLSSMQFGIPRMIRQEQVDTRIPGNYVDADLFESMTELPPAKPDTHFTAMSYHIFKGKLTATLIKITDEASSTLPSPYERILELDAELTEAFEAMPQELRTDDLLPTVTDGTGMILKRISLALLYHKGICMIHRRHITLSKTNERFAQSRARSMQSAKTILRFQITLYEETQPGGRVYNERWMISGLVTEDFTLAAMVICLNLDVFWSMEHPIASYEEEFEDKNELVYLLERSHAIWDIWKTQPGLATFKANKAGQVLKIMIRKIKDVTAGQEGANPETVAPIVSPSTFANTPHLLSGVPTVTDSSEGGIFTPQNPVEAYEFPGLAPVSNWIEMPQEIDWRAWDDILQPNDAIEVSDDVWNFGTDDSSTLSNGT